MPGGLLPDRRPGGMVRRRHGYRVGMSDPAPDVDADRDFRTVPDGHRPGSPKMDSLAADQVEDGPDHQARPVGGGPAPDDASGGADPDHPGLGAAGDPGDEAGSAEDGEDLVRRAAGMKPSKETGHAGSSSDRPAALDPDS